MSRDCLDFVVPVFEKDRSLDLVEPTNFDSCVLSQEYHQRIKDITTSNMSPIQKNVEAASDSYSSSFTQGHLALPPAKKYLVLTCMDARIDPARAFGIELGDAHVVRNVREIPYNRFSFRMRQQPGRKTEVRC
jgi:hypothetical protein